MEMETPLASRIRAALKHANKSPADLSRETGITDSAISQWMSGQTKTIRSENATKVAKACGVALDWLITGKGEMVEDQVFPRDPSDEDYAYVVQYNVKGSCGPGAENSHVEIRGKLAFKRDWLSFLGVKAENAMVIYAEGDSMAPKIEHGDVVLVDTSLKPIQSGKVYALRVDGEVRIKRLFKSVTGGWKVASDNQDKARYPDEEINDPSQDIVLLGRCVWSGGGL